MSLCEGLLTRIRKTDKVDEKAVLDFFLVNDHMKPFIIKMVIDEEKDHILTNLSQAKKNHRAVDSDHLSLQLYMNLQFSKLKPDRKVLFNIKNKSCQEKFKYITDQTTKLSDCFNNDSPILEQSKKFLKTLNSFLH